VSNPCGFLPQTFLWLTEPLNSDGWHLAGTASLRTALRNGILRQYGFLLPSDLAATM